MQSLAVLPFVNANDDPNFEYLSDGLTENLINSLSEISRLSVAPRSTVFRFKKKDADPVEVGRALGVDTLLTGRVFQRGDSINVQTELIHVLRNSQLWGRQYDRKISDREH